MNGDTFIKSLENTILYDDSMFNQSKPVKNLNFFGNVDCPLKRNFKEMVDETLDKYSKTTGLSFNYLIPEVSSGKDDYEQIWKVDSVNNLPDVCVSGGFTHFFKKDFVDKFVSEGYFQSPNMPKINKDFKDADCIDPEGIYTMYAAAPFVMLVDKSELGNLPVPRKWSDLLKPCYEKKIMISGSCKDKVHYILPAYIHKDHGYEGVRRLAKNVKDVWNTAKMARNAGSSSNHKAAIYVMTWLFAKACPNTESTEIIWPEDGAIISPLLMLSKKSKISEMDIFIKILTGKEYGEKSVDLFYPVSNPEIDNKLPANSKLKWIGWDYLRNNNMDLLKKNFQHIFTDEWIRRSNSVQTDFLNLAVSNL